MQPYSPTVVVRHTRENLKKCSLRGLELRPDFLFFTYPLQIPIELKNYIYLCVDGPPLSPADFGKGLFVIDATWRLAYKMEKSLQNHLSTMEKRSIPTSFTTAYPRRQDDCLEPGKGLASIEAIYAAYEIMGRSTEGLLENYYWKNDFLLKRMG